MLVFRYDKSFDGLLSALFDAYSLRAFPEALIGPGEPEPLFAERIHEVVTDEAHADRVWRGLERRLIARTAVGREAQTAQRSASRNFTCET